MCTGTLFRIRLTLSPRPRQAFHLSGLAGVSDGQPGRTRPWRCIGAPKVFPAAVPCHAGLMISVGIRCASDADCSPARRNCIPCPGIVRFRVRIKTCEGGWPAETKPAYSQCRREVQ